MRSRKSLIFGVLCIVLAVECLPVALAEEAWWHTYTPIVSSPNRLGNGLETVNAGAWRTAAYHGGWYGLWDHQAQEERGNGKRTWKKLAEAGGKRLFYFDAGEVGDYAAFFGPDGEMKYTGWSVPWWEGDEVTARWFGLADFFENAPWSPYPTAKDYGLPALTRPDGSPAKDLYPVLSVRGFDEEWNYSYFSNKRVTDEIARGTGLADISKTQEDRPEVRGKTGWITTRLVHLDHANPQLRDYHCQELAMLLDWIPSAGIHVDNFGDLGVRRPTMHGFGLWSLHAFREYMKGKFSQAELEELGIEDVEAFDIRTYINQKPFDTRGRKWPHLKNPKWATDKVWKCYLISQVRAGLSYHRALYRSVKKNHANCAVTGNTIPLFPGRALMKGICDVAHFEWNAAGRYGHLKMAGLPPDGRVGYVTRLGAAISDAPYCWPGLYVKKNLSGKGHEELHKVLAFDCLANRGLMDFNHWFLDNYSPGTPRSAGFVNGFINEQAPRISDRRYLADVGLVYSPWSDIATMTVWGPRPEQFVQEYSGWATFLSKTHRQWNVLLAQDLTYENLRRFPVVVFPSILTVTDTQIEAIRRYVGNGGRVVATGFTGTRRGPKRYLQPRRTKALHEIRAHSHARTTTDRPGVSYWTGKEVEGAAGKMESLLDFEGYSQRLTTEAPETVGVNLNIARRPEGSVLTLDANNYDIDVGPDTVTPTKPFRVKIRLPERLQGEDLSVSLVTASSEKREPVPLANASVERNRRQGTLTLTVPSFRYYTIVFIRPTSGP